MVEYALIMGLMAVVAGSIMSGMSTNISRVFALVASEVAPGASQTGTSGGG
jgi:Flp pilus assembly pilin Flp